MGHQQRAHLDMPRLRTYPHDVSRIQCGVAAGPAASGIRQEVSYNKYLSGIDKFCPPLEPPRSQHYSSPPYWLLPIDPKCNSMCVI